MPSTNDSGSTKELHRTCLVAAVLSDTVSAICTSSTMICIVTAGSLPASVVAGITTKHSIRSPEPGAISPTGSHNPVQALEGINKLVVGVHF